MACHSAPALRAGRASSSADREQRQPGLQARPGRDLRPRARSPSRSATYAKADYGPNLSNIAAKFQSQRQGLQVAGQLDQGPRDVPPQEPDAQPPALAPGRGRHRRLDPLGPGRVAGARSTSPPSTADEVKEGLDELVKLYVTKGGYQAADGKIGRVPLSEVDEFVATKLSQDEKLMFLGEKTISRLGCFGCHTIPGFENAKPIGTPLNGWGIKSPTQARLRPHRRVPRRPAGRREGRRATAPTRTTRRSSSEHTRIGLPLPEAAPAAELRLPQEEREDIKAWDDRLRMPQFAWANDPAAIEEVMTFVLGLTGEKIAAKYLPKTHYTPARPPWPGAQAPEPVQLHGLPRPGDAQVHDRRRARRSTRRSPTSRPTSGRRTTAGRRDYLAEFYPDLTYDPKKKPDAELEAEPIGPTRAPSPSRGCRSACSRTS